MACITLRQRINPLAPGAGLLWGDVPGAYLAPDASETMRGFMVAGRPDPAGFWQAISPMLRQAVKAGGPIHLRAPAGPCEATVSMLTGHTAEVHGFY